MSFQIGFIFCALLLQNVTAQCIRRGYDAFAYDPRTRGLLDGVPKFLTLEDLTGCSANNLAGSNSFGLAVTSSSPFSPTGLFVLSENSYEGPLIVTGQIPFVGAVNLDGLVPTGGNGAVTYACGKGCVSILSENIINGFAEAYGFAPRV